MATLTADLIKRVSGSFSLDIVERLDVSSRGLTDLGPDIAQCVNLKDLVLSDNRLRDVSALGALSSLRKLDLSGNLVEGLEWARGLAALETLSLQGNRVGGVDELQHLRGLGEPIPRSFLCRCEKS